MVAPRSAESNSSIPLVLRAASRSAQPKAAEGTADEHPGFLGIPLLDTRPARIRAIGTSVVAVVAIALVDWKVKPNVSLGFFYVFPILVLALFAKRWQIVTVAAACGVMREALGPLPWDGDAAARVVMGLVAFLGAGLFVSELARNRKLAVEHAAQLRQQIALREELEEELRILVESSPAAILTLDDRGRILLANEAVARLLDLEGQPMRGEPPPVWWTP